MKDIFDSILDSIGAKIKKWAESTGKPVFGYGCIIVGALSLIWFISEGKDYFEYMTKPNRFSVEENISYEDLTEKGTMVVEDKNEHEYLVKHWYEVDGEKYEYEDEQKGNPHGITHYFWRDENGVAHKAKGGTPLLLLWPGLICVGGFFYGVLDIKQFNKKKNENAQELPNNKKKSRDEANAIVELNKRDKKRQLEQQNKNS